MEDEKWFIRLRGKVTGPFDSSQLDSLRRRGLFGAVHEVSTDRKNWTRAGLLLEQMLPQAKTPANAPSQDIDVPMTQTASQAPSFADGSATDQQWFYSTAGQRLGPFNADVFRQMIQAGSIKHSDFVWREGLPQWLPASTFPELAVPKRRSNRRFQSRGTGPALAYVILVSLSWMVWLFWLIWVSAANAGVPAWQMNPDELFAIGLTANLIALLSWILYWASGLLFMIWLYKAWSAVPRRMDNPSPGMAVGLLFVPFFNIFWMFRVVPGLSSTISQTLRKDDPETRAAAGFGVGLSACIIYLVRPVAYLIIFVLSFLAATIMPNLSEFVFGAILVTYWIFSVITDILFSIWVLIANDAKNRLA